MQGLCLTSGGSRSAGLSNRNSSSVRPAGLMLISLAPNRAHFYGHGNIQPDAVCCQHGQFFDDG